MEFLTPLAAIIGMVSGTAGLVLGIVNHRRDRAAVEVTLEWGMMRPGDPDGAKQGIVNVVNIGRRSIFVSHVHLLNTAHGSFVVLMDSVAGAKLSEGDPPKSYDIPHSEAERKIGTRFLESRAVVVDSAGKLYCSMLDTERSAHFGRIRWWWNCRRSRLYKLTPGATKVGDEE
jgi:hypothetical protein